MLAFYLPFSFSFIFLLISFFSFSWFRNDIHIHLIIIHFTNNVIDFTDHFFSGPEDCLDVLPHCSKVAPWNLNFASPVENMKRNSFILKVQESAISFHTLGLNIISLTHNICYNFYNLISSLTFHVHYMKMYLQESHH